MHCFMAMYNYLRMIYFSYMFRAKRILVTSALPYANGPLHIGHLAGAYISADIYVRFMRLCGKDVLYIGGSDEHGAAITIKALKENRKPQDIVDQYHAEFKEAFSKMRISFDIYHRTSEKIHHETSQEFFKELYKNDEFQEIESEQYYDTEANQFLADRYIVGTCPNCKNEEAYGDQCENCGSSLSPTELINPKSTISGSQPTLRKTKHWYLSLDKYEEWLKDYIEKGILDGKEHHNPSDWKNHVIGQCKSWLDGGLRPRSMTRDLDWGVDVPKEIPGSEGKKLYVWMDAPIGYISATKQWAIDNDKDWEPYWKDEKTALIHFIGKDNIVFHCLTFPAILKAHGNYILPQNVPANQFLNLEGRKISTSKNWAVWVNDYLKDLEGKEDELRYHMIKIMPEQRDSEFTWKGFQESVNNELVNNLANFTNRVIVLTHKYYDGVVPAFDENQGISSCHDKDELSFHDSELISLFDGLAEMGDNVRKFDFRAALSAFMTVSSQGNQLLQFNEPWKHVKDDPELVKVVINIGMQYVAAISIACRPFLPKTSDKLRSLLQLDPITENGEWDTMMNILAEGEELLIPNGHKIGDASHLFSRIDDEVIQTQIDKLMASSQTDKEVKSPIKTTVQFDDFTKLDIRTATITAAEAHPNADKLLKLTVDLGFETRTVVSGIAKFYSPDDIIGKKVSLLANLAPRKIRGIESNGMILMAEDDEGQLAFVSPENGMMNGAVVR